MTERRNNRPGPGGRGDVIAAVVLAAGASTRMGTAKALLPVGGQPLLARVVGTARAAGAESVVVAVGPPHGEAIRRELAGLAVAWAWNDRPERGMLSSVQTALRQVPAAAVGALIWPVDVPFVTAASVRALLAGDCGRMRVPVVAPAGRAGHPLWLPAGLFAETMALPANVEGGLRALRSRHPPERVAVADDAILCDVDTPEELEAARRYWGGG